MRISRRHHQVVLFALRIVLGVLFAYFGTRAVMQPDIQIGWLADWVRVLPFFGTELFIRIFGVLEMLVAAALIVGVYVRASAFVAVGFIVLVIINLGLTEAALMNLPYLVAALTVATVPEYKWTLRRNTVI